MVKKPDLITPVSVPRNILSAEEMQELRDRFFYLKPSGAGVFRHAELSEAFLEVAEEVMTRCLASRERSLALTNLEQAKFWASAAVARNEWTR